MSKREFKIGDRVRYVKHSDCGSDTYKFKIGKEYKIKSVYAAPFGGTWYYLEGVDTQAYSDQIELIKPKKLSLFDLEEGKVYERAIKDKLSVYKVEGGILKKRYRNSCQWVDVKAPVNLFNKGFTEITEPMPLAVPSLDYDIQKNLDGSIKIAPSNQER